VLSGITQCRQVFTVLDSMEENESMCCSVVRPTGIVMAAEHGIHFSKPEARGRTDCISAAMLLEWKRVDADTKRQCMTRR
jgi:hypothetical protein